MRRVSGPSVGRTQLLGPIIGAEVIQLLGGERIDDPGLAPHAPPYLFTVRRFQAQRTTKAREQTAGSCRGMQVWLRDDRRRGFHVHTSRSQYMGILLFQTVLNPMRPYCPSRLRSGFRKRSRRAPTARPYLKATSTAIRM